MRQKAIDKNKKTMLRKGRHRHINPNSNYSARIALFLDLLKNMLNFGLQIDANTYKKAMPKQVPKQIMNIIETSKKIMGKNI